MKTTSIEKIAQLSHSLKSKVQNIPKIRALKNFDLVIV